MTTDPTIDLRPRTAGEVLDDAWRLALADAPLLLALSGLFAVPAVVVLLLLLTRPVPESVLGQCLLPALAALLLPLTGLGSAACQELFRRRASGERVTLGACLRAALRRGPQHAAGRALTLLGVGLAGLFLLLPGLALWVSLGTLHSLLVTGDGQLIAALRDAARDAQRQPARFGAVILSRVPLLLVTVLNLFLLVEVGLWVGGSLAGLEVAFLDLLLSPRNPAYVVPLVALAWLVLTPYFEASNFLLHLDNRVRYDGLDLAYRIRALFPALGKGRVAGAVLALGGLLLAAGPAPAEDARLTAVRQVRRNLGQLIEEVKTADPFPGAGRYQARVRRLADRLRQAEGGRAERVRWFEAAAEELGGADRAKALRVLDQLDQRLAQLEDSLQPREDEAVPRRSRAQVKEKLPPAQDGTGPAKSKPPEKPREEKKEIDDEPPRHAGGGGSGAVGANAGGAGLGTVGWVLLGGLAAVVLVGALILFLRHGDRAEPARTPATQAPLTPEAPSLEPDEQSPNDLWRRAEALAREGHFLEGVRHLYLAVLTLLHRADLIRYEKTRTNGEYLRQLRGADDGGAVVEPFRRLTRLFEQKWYGQRACAADDYHSCLGLASEVREGAKK